MAGRPQVLLLVSDPILGETYHTTLEKMDYTCIWCEDPTRWRNHLRKFDYDVIVLDLALTLPDRIGAIREVRLAAPNSDLIVLADHAEVTTAVAALRSGCADYLLKPTNPETLHWAISKSISERQLQLEDAAHEQNAEVLALAHQINVSENESQMRELAIQFLSRWVPGSTAQWVTDAVTNPETLKKLVSIGVKPSELFCAKRSAASKEWFHAGLGWIPLRSAWMGGLFLERVAHAPSTEALQNIEFLVRHLEVSLENHRRFVDAKQLTFLDELTGLYNQRYLEFSLRKLTHLENPFGVLFIDTDKFKSVNDTHGHLAGTSIIIQLGKYLRTLVREGDELYRYGGDEFIVLLNQVSLPGALDSAERIRKEVERKPFSFEKHLLHITLSIGVAQYPDQANSAKALLQLADEAMYAVKRSGRNAVFLAKPLAQAA